MKTLSIETVENFINPNLNTPELDTDTHNAIMAAKEKALYDGKYNSKFQKTEHYFSNENWKEIARDIAKEINS